jgi:LPS O-antigen subunit length determinant protein (WzzB/FepE family)
MRQRALTDAERNIEYLNDQLGRTNVVELQQVIYNLIEAEMKTLMLANVRNEYAFSVVDPAVVPELRARPKRKQLVVLGALLGGIVGLFVVAVSRSLQNLRVEQSALRDARSPS